MGYRKEDIPGMIDCLKQVRRRLWRGKGSDAYGCQFICPLTFDKSAHSMVGEALEGQYTLECWLRVFTEIEPNHLSDRQMQRIRLHWLDKMIADLKDYAK